METWQCQARQKVLDHSTFLSVENHTVQLPSGEIISDWPIVITPDYVDVLVQDLAGKFIVFHQYKYAVGGQTMAPIGGYLAPGEDPLVGAKRELLEETGYISDQWVKLGEYLVDANRGVGTAHLYLALSARQVQPREADDLEEQRLLVLDRQALEESVENGKFKVLAWTTVVLLGLRYIDQLPRFG